MISSRSLLKMARKWRKFTINARKRIATSRSGRFVEAESCTKSVAEKGHFVVYTNDGSRFMVPLANLSSPIFIELLRMSEEQFGLPCDGPIKLPCEGVFMEYVVSFLKRHVSKHAEKAPLSSIATGRCSTPSLAHQGQTTQQQILVHGFYKKL